MPEFPDVSYDAYKNNYLKISNHPDWNRAGVSSYAWANGYANYENWRENEMTAYNTRLSAYNTWLSSGAGKRASALSGQYNPSYFDNSNPSASPVQYGSAPEGAGWSEMAQGVSGLFSFLQGLQGLKLASEEIRGKALENASTAEKIEGQKIQNRWLERLNSGRCAVCLLVLIGFVIAMKLNFISVSVHSPVLPGGLMHYGMNDYDFTGVPNSFVWNRAAVDIQFRRAARELTLAQKEMATWNAKEREWYVKNMQSIQKDILNGTLTYLNGEIKFQEVEQRLRKAGAIVGMGTNVINTAVNAVKAFIPASGVIDGIGKDLMAFPVAVGLLRILRIWIRSICLATVLCLINGYKILLASCNT